MRAGFNEQTLKNIGQKDELKQRMLDLEENNNLLSDENENLKAGAAKTLELMSNAT